MTQQPRQLWLSTTACLCLLFLPLTSVGTGLCRGLTRVDWQKNGVRNYRQGGTDTSSLHTSVCECWVACADATHTSAVSSHWLILLPRSPCDSEFLSWLLWSHMFSMAEGGRDEAPVRMVATSSLWHNRKTHTSAWRHSAPASNWASHIPGTREHPAPVLLWNHQCRPPHLREKKIKINIVMVMSC